MGNNTFRGGLYALLALVCVWASTVQFFNLTLGLPLSALPYPLQSGSLAVDFSGADDSGGATLNIHNKDGRADGAVKLKLLSGSFSCGDGPGCNGSIAPVSTDQIFHHGSAKTDTGLNVFFSLTPEDSTAFDTRLEIVPVPIPAAVWLFGFCLIGLAGVARRFKSVS